MQVTKRQLKTLEEMFPEGFVIVYANEDKQTTRMQWTLTFPLTEANKNLARIIAHIQAAQK